MRRYVLSSAAELDLNDIWEYIAQDSTHSADRWIARLFEAFEALSKTPRMGHKREDVTPLPVLFWPVGSYLIIYRVHDRKDGGVGADGERQCDDDCGGEARIACQLPYGKFEILLESGHGITPRARKSSLLDSRRYADHRPAVPSSL